MTPITLHAKLRARERYSVILTDDDALALIALCKNGRAPCMRSDHLGRVHIGALDGKIMVFSLHPHEDRILTFLPRDYFSRGAKKAHRHSAGRWQERAGVHVAAENPTYSRAALKREAIDLGDEE